MNRTGKAAQEAEEKLTEQIVDEIAGEIERDLGVKRKRSTRGTKKKVSA